ncbi:hypothetical protein E2N92_01435 [Methanofollis formosanus]|uniref:Uncharacterized protein n=1 Tax=Methanofollis formosanus TaxID=299308 RepID=A0A8G0ZYX8_9EURY|nr:hypothetical protein [Methanofollis formosanus]QYZ78186.1 hypothetical protein E2N92_01435 [Methanofollis formosanus]
MHDRTIIFLSILIIFSVFSFAIGILVLSAEEGVTWTESFDLSKKSENTTLCNSESGEENFCIGLYTAPTYDPKYFLQKEIYLNESENFEGYFCIANNMHNGNDYLVFCLMDYKQVPFSFNENNPQTLHMAHLEPFEERFYHFDLGPTEKGTHEFEIFLILKPYEISLDQSFRLSTDLVNLGSVRLNVFVDDQNMPPISYTNFSSLHCRQCNSQYPVNDGVMITKEPCSAIAWTSSNVTSGETLHYWINVAADDDYPVTFGLITLMDYIQVPINTKSSQDVVFGRLNAGEKLSFPGSTVVPTDKGVHQLMVIWIPAPNHRLNQPYDLKANPEQWAWAQPSIRVELNVT